MIRIPKLAYAPDPGGTYAGTIETITLPNGNTYELEKEILWYADAESFPETGSAGKIYVAMDTNAMYRWDGTGDEYVPVSSGGGSAALSKVAFSIATTDWEAVTGGYSAGITDSAFTSYSDEFITYTPSMANLRANVNAEKDASTHTITLVTAAMPAGTVSGTVYSISNPNGDTGVILVSDKLPIERGGTNAATAAEALSNLGGIASTEKGAAGGVATLNSGGTVTSAQLPDSVNCLTVADGKLCIIYEEE